MVGIAMFLTIFLKPVSLQGATDFCDPSNLECDDKPQGPDHYFYDHETDADKSDNRESSIDIAKNITSYIALNDGVKIPLFGLGLCCEDTNHYTDIGEVMRLALEHGYRMFDTAAVFNTEIDTGRAIQKTAVKREDIFVVTKLWNDQHGTKNAKKAFHESLKKLSLDYIDMYLIQSPSGGHILDTYDAILELKEQGLVRSVGVSNFGIQHLEGIKQSGRPMPSVNQIELHPWQRKEDIVQYCRKEGIALMGYSPLTRGEKLKDPILLKMTQEYKVSTAQLLIRWSLQNGFITIPKAFGHDHIVENTHVFDWSIIEQDLSVLNRLPDWSNSWAPGMVDPWGG